MSEMECERPGKWSAKRAVTLALVLLGFCVLILLGAAYAYYTALHHEDLRTDCLIAIIVAGAGATVCLAGVVYLVDRPLVQDDGPAVAWHVRLALGEFKRVLMVIELATMGLGLAAAGVLIFGFKLPG